MCEILVTIDHIYTLSERNDLQLRTTKLAREIQRSERMNTRDLCNGKRDFVQAGKEKSSKLSLSTF